MKLAFIDFDHTLVDDNSDTWILKVLDKESYELMKTLCRSPERLGWTAIMNASLKKLVENGHSPLKVLEKLKEIPCNPYLPLFLENLKKEGFVIYIVSDANIPFIQTILTHYQCLHHVEKIISNVLTLHDTGDWTLQGYYGSPLHPLGHDCQRCGLGMCKGGIVREVLAQHQNVQAAVFIGDGDNDFCGMLGLSSTTIPRLYGAVRKDFALARRVHELPKAFPTSLWTTLDELSPHLKQQFSDNWTEQV